MCADYEKKERKEKKIVKKEKKTICYKRNAPKLAFFFVP